MTDPRSAPDPALELRNLLGQAKTAWLAGNQSSDETTALAQAILAARWRPPLSTSDQGSLRAVVAGAIGRHTGDDDPEKVAAAYAAADTLIDRGWLDKTGPVGPPEPVATTLRRVIKDLESEAAARLALRNLTGVVTGRTAEDVRAAETLRAYAERLRQHPSLADDTGALPIPRVFFPGDTMPAGMWFVAEGQHNGVTTPALSRADRTVRVSPKVEVLVPTGQQLRAAIDQARVEREADRG